MTGGAAGQSGLDALDRYTGTKVSSGKFTPLSEANAGKPALDPQEEYIFELVERDAKESNGFLSDKDKQAGAVAPKVMKAFLTWKETKTGNLVFMTQRIDSLYWGNSDGTMKSGVISFLEDIGIPVPAGKIPHWGSTFILTMKIRARVVPRIKNNQPVPNEYKFKEGSFRKYTA